MHPLDVSASKLLKGNVKRQATSLMETNGLNIYETTDRLWRNKIFDFMGVLVARR